jgi:hypothetical protein
MKGVAERGQMFTTTAQNNNPFIVSLRRTIHGAPEPQRDLASRALKALSAATKYLVASLIGLVSSRPLTIVHRGFGAPGAAAMNLARSCYDQTLGISVPTRAGRPKRGTRSSRCATPLRVISICGSVTKRLPSLGPMRRTHRGGMEAGGSRSGFPNARSR